MRVEEVLDALRRAVGTMAPAVADSVVTRSAKVAFRVSSVVMLASVGTVFVTLPRPQI